MEGYLCISNVKFAKKDSNTKREEKHVQNNVHISYEGKTLVIRNQEKSYKFANGVVVNDMYHLPIRTESFVALIVGMNLIQEKIVRSGTEINSTNQSHMNTIKEWLKSEDGLSKIESVVNAVEKDVKTNQNSMRITKEVLNTKNLDTIYRTLSYFVEVVIQKFMYGEKKSLLEIDIDWDWAFDKAQEVNSDSQLYKQAGNSVTVPVIYEIAKRLV
nr:DNA cytosine methyltransferase [Bacillus sp. AFS014408]